MNLSFNCPINPVSFGQVSTALLREAFQRKDKVLISLIGDKFDLRSQKLSEDFFLWIGESVKSFSKDHKREDPTFRLWHLNDSSTFLSDNQALFTFFEIDSLTDTEKNIAKNNRKVILSSNYAVEIFKSHGVDAHFVPLGFDKDNFEVLNKKFFEDDRIVFNLSGKFEHRKRHAKALGAWAKKFGDNKKYFLQCSLYNIFLGAQRNNELISTALGYKKYYNISFFGNMEKNSEYNDYLNSANIIIGMSGGEGWGLPEFQSVALGKHAVILNAHAYKEWANSENSVLVDSTSKIDCYDGVFFKKGELFNQGQIFDWNEDDFINGCEEAIKRVEKDKVNKKGLELQQKFTYSNTYDEIIKVLEK